MCKYTMLFSLDLKSRPKIIIIIIIKVRLMLIYVTDWFVLIKFRPSTNTHTL